MPYAIHKRGAKFCVVKEGGETIACHKTRAQAEAQRRALYASENKSFVVKADDARYMFLISSNSYKDRAKDIVKEKALQQYVAHFEPNPHLFWHGGDPIGEIIAAEMHGPFLLEISRELPDARINLAREGEPAIWVQRAAVWDAIEKNSIPWGASIGFFYQKGDEQDGAFDTILKKETSTLPLEDAANGITLSDVIGGENMSNAVKTKRRNVLELLNLKGKDANQIDAALNEVRSALDNAGWERKEFDQKKVKGLVEEMQARIMEILGELTDDETKKQALADTIAAELMGTATEVATEVATDMPEATMEDVPLPQQFMELAEQVKALADDSLAREEELKAFIPAFIEMTEIVKGLAPLVKEAAIIPELAQKVEALAKIARVTPSGQPSRDAASAVKDLDLAAIKKAMSDGVGETETVFGRKVRKE